MTKPKRNKFLTKGMEAVLMDLRALEPAGEIAEIVCEGNECYVGNRQTNWQVVYRLLRLCLLKHEDEGRGYHRFEPNSDTYKVLDDPNYEPGIIEVLRTGKPVVR